MTEGQDDSQQESNTLLSRVPTARWTGGVHAPGYLALVGVLVAFWLVGGPWGMLAWLAIWISWMLLPTVVAVAVGQFALLAIVSDISGLSMAGELSLLLLLLSDLVGDTRSISAVLVFIVLASSLTALALWGVSATGLLATTAGMLLLGGAISYLLHRLGLLELGLLTPESDAQR